MRQALSRGWVRLVVAVGLLGILLVAGFGIYLLSIAGDLPWQVDPTRIPITPFADMPTYSVPKIILATPTGP